VPAPHTNQLQQQLQQLQAQMKELEKQLHDRQPNTQAEGMTNNFRNTQEQDLMPKLGQA